VKCDHCGITGKRFESVIQDCKLMTVCVPCIRTGRKAPSKPVKALSRVGTGLPCSTDLVGTDEGEE
jgi:hypothetical protein